MTGISKPYATSQGRRYQGFMKGMAKERAGYAPSRHLCAGMVQGLLAEHAFVFDKGDDILQAVAAFQGW
ncbi:Uncharacterised protein [Klebsiella michiganensis]|nr:Uncharacterised protein [Klebsiella michiganensis]